MKQSIVVFASTILASIALCACGVVESEPVDAGATIDANLADGNNTPDASDTPTICSWDESNWDECSWAP